MPPALDPTHGLPTTRVLLSVSPAAKCLQGTLLSPRGPASAQVPHPQHCSSKHLPDSIKPGLKRMQQPPGSVHLNVQISQKQPAGSPTIKHSGAAATVAQVAGAQPNKAHTLTLPPTLCAPTLELVLCLQCAPTSLKPRPMAILSSVQTQPPRPHSRRSAWGVCGAGFTGLLTAHCTGPNQWSVNNDCHPGTRHQQLKTL